MTSDEKEKINQRVSEMLNIDKFIKHSNTIKNLKRKNRILILGSIFGFLVVSVFISQLAANATKYDSEQFIRTEFKVDDRKVAQHWPRQERMLLASSFPELPQIVVVYDPSLNQTTSI